ncbi:hypothetical protein ILUMI_00226 [Ignelater luminosus]|uniref:Uncharacterized protein n=1 Tax=Ignelater luminosus TaxID=2038154 RepID=A0A8K0GQF9_IGNLU|nr:hypothetical protein ILUMI_00226 [Ignelater luminosus]
MRRAAAEGDQLIRMSGREVLTEKKYIMMRWKEHFRNLLEEQDAEGSDGEAAAHLAVDPVSARTAKEKQ